MKFLQNLLEKEYVGVLCNKHYMKWVITVVQPSENLVLVKEIRKYV